MFEQDDLLAAAEYLSGDSLVIGVEYPIKSIMNTADLAEVIRTAIQNPKGVVRYENVGEEDPYATVQCDLNTEIIANVLHYNMTDLGPLPIEFRNLPLKELKGMDLRTGINQFFAQIYAARKPLSSLVQR